MRLSLLRLGSRVLSRSVWKQLHWDRGNDLILACVVKGMSRTEGAKVLGLGEELGAIVVLVSFQGSSFLKISFRLTIRSKPLLFPKLLFIGSFVSFPFGKRVKRALWLRLKIVILSKFLPWIIKSLRSFKRRELCFQIDDNRLRVRMGVHEEVLSLNQLSILNDHLCILVQVEEILIVRNLVLRKRVL